jgi:hypothetical protein
VTTTNDPSGGGVFHLEAWVPDARWKKQVIKAARRQGADGEPDITTGLPVETPPAISHIEDTVEQWCSNQCAIAIAQFRPILSNILEWTATLKAWHAGTITEDQRKQEPFVRASLAQAKAEMISLEDTLERAVSRSVSFGNSVIQEYWQELLAYHPTPAQLDHLWDPPEIEVRPESLDFGQEEARHAIDDLDGAGLAS